MRIWLIEQRKYGGGGVLAYLESMTISFTCSECDLNLVFNIPVLEHGLRNTQQTVCCIQVVITTCFNKSSVCIVRCVHHTSLSIHPFKQNKKFTVYFKSTHQRMIEAHMEHNQLVICAIDGHHQTKIRIK